MFIRVRLSTSLKHSEHLLQEAEWHFTAGLCDDAFSVHAVQPLMNQLGILTHQVIHFTSSIVFTAVAQL